jgi:GNAT superfamily N-acetyltransferase
MREWWASVFTSEVRDLECQLLVACSHHNDQNTHQVAGALSIRRMTALQRGAGLWSMFPFTEDHDLENLLPLSSAMTQHRERMMFGRTHYLLEVFGVCQKAKGLGLGRILIEAACKIADAEGLDMFVQSNAVTEPFYCKFGFVRDCKVCVKGKTDYIEYMLVRKS